MKTAIDRVLSAEEDARRCVADARERAHALLKNAESQGKQLREAACAHAHAEAESLLRSTAAEAETAARTIADTAAARAQQILREAEHLELAFLRSEIEGIAGIGQ